MHYRKPKSKLELWLHRFSILTLGLIVFLAEGTQLTSTSSFELRKLQRVNTQRFPSSLRLEAFDFDCSKPKKSLEITTQLETIRLVANNCQKKPVLKNVKHNLPLHTFALNAQKYSSEFAYLAKGENQFTIQNGNNEYKISIFRQ